MKAQQRIDRIRELRRRIANAGNRSQVRKDLVRELQGLIAEQLRWEARTERKVA